MNISNARETRPKTHRHMSHATTTIDDLASAIQRAAAPVIAAYQARETHAPDAVSPELLTDALQQFCDVLRRIETDGQNRPDHGVGETDITELADYGLGLLQDLDQWAEQLQQGASHRDIDAQVLPLALWMARHGGALNNLEIIVNTFAARANQTLDTAQLTALCAEMGEIIAATAPAIRQDLDKTNPGRPWRILHLNRGIVATRSYDPALMERVFSELSTCLPDDAADFFREGMRQMDDLDYPAPVREIMQNYHQRYAVKTLH